MWQIAFIDSLTLAPQPNLWFQGDNHEPDGGGGFLRSWFRRFRPAGESKRS